MKDVRVPARGRLGLARESLRRLSHLELAEVRGGSEANLELMAGERSMVGCPEPVAPVPEGEPTC
jgi:hypothetical protein